MGGSNDEGLPFLGRMSMARRCHIVTVRVEGGLECPASGKRVDAMTLESSQFFSLKMTERMFSDSIEDRH